MAEYIERERLLEIIKSLIIPYAGFRSGKKVLNELLMSYREAVLEKIQEASAEDVVPVRHGRWIPTLPLLGNRSLFFRCSICGFETANAKQCCARCFAKMDLEAEDHG